MASKVIIKREAFEEEDIVEESILDEGFACEFFI